MRIRRILDLIIARKGHGGRTVSAKDILFKHKKTRETT